MAPETLALRRMSERRRAKLERERKLDLIHAHYGCRTDGAAAKLSGELPCLVLTLWGSDVPCFPIGLLCVACFHEALRRATHVIAPSRAVPTGVLELGADLDRTRS